MVGLSSRSLARPGIATVSAAASSNECWSIHRLLALSRFAVVASLQSLFCDFCSQSHPLVHLFRSFVVLFSILSLSDTTRAERDCLVFCTKQHGGNKIECDETNTLCAVCPVITATTWDASNSFQL